MIYYDVCNLFTNIPLKETLKLSVNLTSNKRPEIRITRKQLTKLFEFATSGTRFLSNENYCDQIDGVAMGSRLRPVLANLFMEYHEKIWLVEFETCEVLLYRRYFDDIICLFACEKDADEFFTFLNSRHPTIKFTFEEKKDKKIAFLDICINKTNYSFCTSVFWKSRSIGLYTNFSSFTPFSYKIGLIKTLIH